MKILLAFLIVTAAGIWWWQNPDLVKEYAAKSTHATGLFLLNLFDKPAEATVDVKEQPNAVAVPNGVYYTRDRITLTQDGATRVVEKGAQVRKIGEGKGKFLVENAGGRFFVEPHVLTRDSGEVGYILQKTEADSARDTAAAQAATAQKRSLQGQLEDLDRKLADLNRELRLAEATDVVNNLSNGPRKMATPPGFIRNEIARKEKERNLLRQQLTDLGEPVPPPPAATANTNPQFPNQPPNQSPPQSGQGRPPGGKR